MVDDGSSVVSVGTVVDVVVVDVDVVVVATSVVVVIASEVGEVVWARPDPAGASTHSMTASTATPRHHSADTFMTAPAYRRPVENGRAGSQPPARSSSAAAPCSTRLIEGTRGPTPARAAAASVTAAAL